MEKPKEYTKDDIDELLGWFDENRSIIPQSLVLSRSTTIPNLGKTLDFLKSVARSNWANPSFTGYIVRLEEIRTRILGGNVN